MMGLGRLVTWVAWWATFTAMHTLSALVITVAAGAAGLFPGASMLAYFVTIELFVMGVIAASFVVCAVCKSAKASQGWMLLCYMAGFGLFALDIARGRPKALEQLLCLCPFVAGPVGVLQVREKSREEEERGDETRPCGGAHCRCTALVSSTTAK